MLKNAVRSLTRSRLFHAVLFGVIGLSCTASIKAQIFESNEHGLRISYPNGEILFLGKSGDARFLFLNGTSEWGSWRQTDAAIVVTLQERTIRIPKAEIQPHEYEKVSGYCILKGAVVPDHFCY